MAPHRILIADHPPRADIDAALVELSRRARAACIESTRRELRCEQDELLDMRQRA